MRAKLNGSFQFHQPVLKKFLDPILGLKMIYVLRTVKIVSESSPKSSRFPFALEALAESMKNLAILFVTIFGRLMLSSDLRSSSASINFSISGHKYDMMDPLDQEQKIKTLLLRIFK